MLDTIILKCAAPCNLRCTYCYEYSTGDDTWRGKPAFLGGGVARQLGERIAEYLDGKADQAINVVAHGGEPLLMGAALLDSTFEEISDAAGAGRVKFGLQTNGVLLTEEVCDVIRRWEVKVGVSLDGSPEHNERRVDHSGRASHSEAIAGIELLRQYCPQNFGGLLCVVDFERDPESVLGFLLNLKPRSIDLLQPFVTHDTLEATEGQLVERFGDWMVRAARFWLERPEYHHVKIPSQVGLVWPETGKLPDCGVRREIRPPGRAEGCWSRELGAQGIKQ